MKRDMDLIRAILLNVEQQGPPEGWCDVQLPGHSEEEISYHVMLLRDAGLVEAVKLSTQDGVCWRPKRLTYEGHEFLDAARNDTFWNKGKATAIEKTGSLSMEALKIALGAILKQSLGA